MFGAIGNFLGNNLGSLWETDVNTLGTRTPNPPPPPNTAFLFKKENWTPDECMMRLLIDCMKLLFPKLFVTIFGLG
jgi:hypothetical protein